MWDWEWALRAVSSLDLSLTASLEQFRFPEGDKDEVDCVARSSKDIWANGYKNKSDKLNMSL